MTNLLTKHTFNIHVLAYVKRKKCNLSTMTFILTSYEVLGLLPPFVKACWVMQRPSVANMP
jgi:hypothetical protein